MTNATEYPPFLSRSRAVTKAAGMHLATTRIKNRRATRYDLHHTPLQKDTKVSVLMGYAQLAASGILSLRQILEQVPMLVTAPSKIILRFALDFSVPKLMNPFLI